MGLTNQPIEKLAPIARSWLQTPQLTVKGTTFKSEGYSRDERAFILSKTGGGAGMLEFEIAASEESPVVNPAFVVKNWGRTDAELKINGKRVNRGKAFRLGHNHRMEGSDLIVWIKTEATMPIEFSLSPRQD
ncbi:MAG: hypothetical protein ACYSX1_13415 [Planctomycetota bacterium]|jgi:hypothetical protein